MKKIYKKIIIAIFLIYFVVTLISQQKTLNQYKSELLLILNSLRLQKKLTVNYKKQKKMLIQLNI